MERNQRNGQALSCTMTKKESQQIEHVSYLFCSFNFRVKHDLDNGKATNQKHKHTKYTMLKRKITTLDTVHWQSCNNLTIKPYTHARFIINTCLTLIFPLNVCAPINGPGRWSRNNALLWLGHISIDFQWNIRLHQFTYVTLKLSRFETHCKMRNNKQTTKTTSNYVNCMLRLVWQLKLGPSVIASWLTCCLLLIDSAQK